MREWCDRHPFGVGIIVGFMLDETAGQIAPLIAVVAEILA